MNNQNIKKVALFGERGSGTNYLTNILEINFDVYFTHEYGTKHWFGFHDYNNSDDVLFINIVRNPVDWVNSLYDKPWHIPKKNRLNIDSFLNNEIYNVEDTPWLDAPDNGTEIPFSNNIYTGKRYKNLIELRETKIKYMIEDLPKKVKNYIFIRYEDLTENFEETMYLLKNKGLKVKSRNFPINSNIYCNRSDHIKFKKNNYIQKITKEQIKDNKYFDEKLENKIGYFI